MLKNGVPAARFCSHGFRDGQNQQEREQCAISELATDSIPNDLIPLPQKQKPSAQKAVLWKHAEALSGSRGGPGRRDRHAPLKI